MIDSHFTKYIKELSISNSIKEILFESGNPIIKKIVQAKPKKTLGIKYLIAFSGCDETDVLKILNELVKLNEEKNSNKRTSCILFVPSNILLERRPENLTFFNGILYVHIAIFDQEKKQVFYDKDDYYFGVKHIKKAIGLFEKIL